MGNPDALALEVETCLHGALHAALRQLAFGADGESGHAKRVRAIAYDRLHGILMIECPRAYAVAARATQVEVIG